MAETESKVHDRQDQRLIDNLLHTNAASATLARRGRVSAIVLLGLLALLIPAYATRVGAVIANPMETPELGFYVGIPLIIILVTIFFVNRAGKIPLAGMLLALLFLSLGMIFRL